MPAARADMPPPAAWPAGPLGGPQAIRCDEDRDVVQRSLLLRSTNLPEVKQGAQGWPAPQAWLREASVPIPGAKCQALLAAPERAADNTFLQWLQSAASAPPGSGPSDLRQEPGWASCAE